MVTSWLTNLGPDPSRSDGRSLGSSTPDSLENHLATTLILVRHGQTTHNAAGQIAGSTDSPLTLVGHAQTIRLARHIAERYRVTSIYASPLRRARLAAQRIADWQGTQPIFRDDLREIDFGLLEGLTQTEAERRFPNIWLEAESRANKAFRWPEGESTDDFVTRIRRAFSEMIVRHPGETVAVVTHGGVIGACIADIAERAPHLWPRYVPGNCSVSKIDLIGDWLSVGCFNDCSFLVDDTPELARASLIAALPGAGLG